MDPFVHFRTRDGLVSVERMSLPSPPLRVLYRPIVPRPPWMRDTDLASDYGIPTCRSYRLLDRRVDPFGTMHYWYDEE